jgi:adenine-specific DNA-methyltransferase
LVPVASRMFAHHRIQALLPIDRLSHVESHLAGIEIDGFAAWMTRAFLKLLTLQVSREAGRFLHLPVETADALSLVADDRRRFDLIVGNPPFGRVALSPRRRAAFQRSLYGHANLYGVFLDAALRWRKPTGLVAFLTPTSFLGGKYYSRLRALLLDEAPPLVIDLVSDRTGVFPAVQQETCLAVFGRNPAQTTTLHLIEPKNGSLDITRAGSFALARARRGSPWFLPRSHAQARLAERALTMDVRLGTLGYRASTGPLVWNRLKRQIRTRPTLGTFPLIWAEAVRANVFSFDYKTRARRCFIELLPGQEHLLTRRPCVLVQRTTAKEQRRRLIACAVPESFLAKWGAIVVENHVNVLWKHASGHVSPAALAAVLNTAAVDEVFRCLSGSVAVSATELHALPLPDPSLFARIEKLCGEPNNEAAIEDLVADVYGAPNNCDSA